MPPQLLELETLLRQLVAEHRRLLVQVERHEAAVKVLDIVNMEDAGRQQESLRLRIMAIEQRRRFLTQQLTKAMNLQGELTVRNLATLFPAKAVSLLQLRVDLREVIQQITARTNVAGKVAAAVLGHLNTVVRLVSGVVERAGLYTKRGIPKASQRIGLMDAVG
jgi:hypothetical protein